ncbi:MAG: hypothetical protein JWN66_1343 [Sphingomonas bacterium]|uniref:SRPBCC family protein n=1 Tax=Sphingomonas bacterium TaxID=1895847 RepID=UPI00262E130D|nr:SRPBCC family protein [Sphingomonas bacterium]MDB5704227.1 hypothetical protein [Sphingomonas bacterium]
MTSSSITYASVRAELDHPIEAVWARIGVFGGLEDWADGVSACSVDGKGVGAIRTVVRNGNSVQERLEAIDPVGHVLRYQILQPHPLPADAVHGNVILRPLGAGRTEMVWRSDARNFTVPPEALGARIEAFYAASIEGLRRLLGGG